MTPNSPSELVPLVRVESLTKVFEHGGRRIEVLRGINISLARGEMLAVVGMSGVGKSTLLHVLGTIDLPSSGTIYFEGRDLGRMSPPQLAEFRNQSIGFVFQFHHLLPEFTALENVMMPALIHRVPRGQARLRAEEMLAAVGLSERKTHRPGELSGGEQQRVALARSLVMQPKLLLADEPTGNLDSKTGGSIHELFFELNARLHTTMLIVTHNSELAARMPRCLRMVDGVLYDVVRPEPDSVAARPARGAGMSLQERRVRPATSSGCWRMGVLVLLLGTLFPWTQPRAEEPPLVVKIAFRGNRKVEDAAIRAVLHSKVGQPLVYAHLAADVRAIWGMGYFDDAKVEMLTIPSGAILVYLVKEKPSVRKVIVGGNDEIDLDKINEVLDLKKESILDVAQVKRNQEKIKDLYIEKGFYLAEVRYTVRPVSLSQVDIVFTVEEHAKVVIRRITFLGNHNISSKELKAAMGTQEGGLFSWITSSGTYQEDAFERDLLLVQSLYYDRGFINVKLSRPEVALSADKRYMYITIHVEESKQFYLGKLDIRGDLLWPRQKMMQDLGVHSGELFNRSRLGKDILALTDKYKDRGYAYANITPLTSIDSDKRIVDLVFEIQKGQVVIFERINIGGNSKTRDKVIRRELKIAEGDQYSQTLLNRSRARVMQLGFFESVDVSTRRGSADDRIVVNLEIKEKPTGTFQVGAGFSSVENFIAQAQVAQENLFGRGQRLALMAQISGMRQLFSLSFWEPYFLDSNWTFGFDIYNSVRNFESFNRNATGGNFTWGYPLTDDIRIYMTYKAEYVDVTTGAGTIFGSSFTSPLPSGVQVANLFNSGITSSARFFIQWDTRNNRLFPSKGFFHSAWAEFASSYIGSKNVFNRYGAFSRWYYPIWGPFVFKFNGEIGLITSTEAAGVPIFERFFVGGIMDVRGFRPRSLGPRIPVLTSPDPNQSIFYFNKGGNKQLIFNAEIEFPIFEKVGIKGVVFSDAGMAFDDNENLSITALRHSAGFGFRWFSPIGPLRFEWGLPLSPKPGEDAIVFEFTIGNFF